MAFKKSFNKQGGGSHRKPFKKSFGDRSTDRPAQMFSAVCAKCGKTCEVPFRPSPGRSVFCRDCFRDAGDGANSRTHDKRGGADRDTYNTTSKPQSTHEDKRIGEIKWLVEKVENKIDSIIAMLEKQAGKQAEKQGEKQNGAAAEPTEKKKKTDKTGDKKTAKKV